MNLGTTKISESYPYLINQSGLTVTLGDGATPNWIGTTVASTTGTQTISGVKTFFNNIIFSGNVGIGNNSPTSRLDVSGSIKAQSFIIPQSGVKLNSNFALTNSAQWYNIISGTLDSGNWLVNSSLMASANTANPIQVYCRLANSANTNFYSSTQNFLSGSSSGIASMNLTTIVPLTSTTTVVLQAASTFPNTVVMTGLSGASVYTAGGHTTQITALEIS